MKYIMVIDDSQAVQTSIEFAIQDIDYSVINSPDGIEGMNKIKEIKKMGDHIALCVVDINKPRIDGVKFINEFRKDDLLTPIIALAAESQQLTTREGKEVGATGYIIKPFQPLELANIVLREIK